MLILELDAQVFETGICQSWGIYAFQSPEPIVRSTVTLWDLE